MGRGRASINSLPGHVGDYDVKDVHEAALHVLKDRSDVLDPSRVLVFGGSHGGFLTAHLIGTSCKVSGHDHSAMTSQSSFC